MGPKPLVKITNVEWVSYWWIEVTEPKDEERMFIRGRERTPDEAAAAMIDFDNWIKARRATNALDAVGANA